MKIFIILDLNQHIDDQNIFFHKQIDHNALNKKSS